MSREAPLPNVASLAFVEELYARFLADPTAVDPEWRGYFEDLRRSDPFAGRPQLGPSARPSGLFRAGSPSANGHHATNGAAPSADLALLQDRVDQLIRAYRVRGHLLARLDPLGLPRDPQPELEASYYGLTEADLERTFSSSTIYGLESGTLRQILERLHETYCRSIGVQFMHIDDLQVKNWLTERMESTTNRLELTRAQARRVLKELTDAVIFEDFLQKKFLGAKRFSLEGGESLIPLLDLAIEEAARHGVREVVFGMAHRGRINVLANIMGKPPAEIFYEFADKNPEQQLGRGDVKYHLGYSHDRPTEAGHDVHLSLCFNPSHLEFVNPVALGRVRAKQDRVGDQSRDEGMALLIHGDAAFIGQGVVQESLNLSQLEGYGTGGTVHVIVN
ncbi:MAG: thiamine pyrophosphate-dependent enzyme, partial [Planctomycetota bacterium]